MSNSLANAAVKFFDRKFVSIDPQSIKCFRIELERFCESGKKEDAFSVYYCFCDIFKIFGEATLGKLVKFLSDHEYHSGELLLKHRDHYSHSVYVFALGLAVYANNKPYRDAIKKFYNDDFTDDDFLYHWGLVGLFHDIGYPFQLAHEQIRDYMDDLFEKKDDEKTDKHHPHAGYLDMEELLYISDDWKQNSGFPTCDLNELFAKSFHKRMPYFEYNDIAEALKHRATEPVFMDHGYFSALLLSHQLMKAGVPLIEKLLDALTAILLHNSIIRFYLGFKQPEKRTRLEVHPLAYLIMLCDEFQKWDRQAFGSNSKKAPIAWKFDIKVSDDEIDLDYAFDSDTCYIKELEENGSAVIGYLSQKDNPNVAKPKFESAASITKDIEVAVVPHVKIVPTMRLEHKDKKTKNFASSNKLLDLEVIAMGAHKAWDNTWNPANNPSIPHSFAELPLFFKLDNIDQAKSYAWKLELINAFYSSEDMDYEVVKFFEKDDLDYLSAQEHVRWVKNRIRYGWSYSKVRNDAELKHPSIIPYGILSDEERAKDYEPTMRMVSVLESFGIKIYSFRDKWKPVLKVFGTGHRDIDLSNPEEVERIEKEIEEILLKYSKTHRVVVKTCFSAGADLLIAKVALKLGLSIDAAIPFPYEKYVEEIHKDALSKGYEFGEKEENEWRNIIAQTIFYHEEPLDSPNPYEAASLYNLNQANVLIALWDGKEIPLRNEDGQPINRGGTYHMITLAESKLEPIPVYEIKCHRIN